ncbi:cystathionine beta-lyase [Acrasis kona]|uniref:Cystathionine beta-lyase n=1 Tax=Acrasis kona TaxID=1008807 RepID=A0AAW2ZHM2_9EUKA
MKQILIALFVICFVGISQCDLIKGFKPPATPLFVVDPQFSVWAPSHNLTDAFTTHWTGATKAVVGVIRIDDKPYRYLGPQKTAGSDLPEPIKQTDLIVFPTRTVYTFEHEKLSLEVQFSTPLLTDDYDLLSRPITYITYKVKPKNGPVKVQLYIDVVGEIATDNNEEVVQYSSKSTDVSTSVIIGTVSQPVVEKGCDGCGINWGYFYLTAPKSSQTTQVIALADDSRTSFSTTGRLPSQSLVESRKVRDGYPVVATAWDLGVLNSPKELFAIASYDDIVSIDFFGQHLKAYWTQKFATLQDLLDDSVKQYSVILEKLKEFDEVHIADLTRVGGDTYATVASLAYRQALGGMKLVWNDKNKMPWYFLKEISSDGDASTVDVIYPASPILLFFNPKLLLQQLLPIVSYAANETWSKYPHTFAPHHLGIYPVCNIVSGAQEDMPVEETANMLQMWSAVVQRADDAEVRKLTQQYWSLFTVWADYLVSVLPDPGEQLCTDDFTGPSPHNSNLAAKGIIGIAAYAQIAAYLQKSSVASKYHDVARGYSVKWIGLATAPDGSHTKLQYDKPDSFSLKYNIYYQNVLNITLFDPKPDIKYYLASKNNKYGTPLDNRANFTKLDWYYWVAAISTPDQFKIFAQKGYDMAGATTRGIPLTDWYETDTAAIKGFRARPVVGGIYAKMALSRKF